MTFSVTALAQSGMTDKQVMQFMIKENQRGTPRAEIVTKLIERGVISSRFSVFVRLTRSRRADLLSVLAISADMMRRLMTALVRTMAINATPNWMDNDRRRV